MIESMVREMMRQAVLRYAKKESQILILKMYYKEGLPCLNRKFEKLEKILKIDKTENLKTSGCGATG